MERLQLLSKNIVAMRIKTIVFFAILSFSGELVAQQNFQLSQYVRSTNLLNPAFAGMEDNIELSGGYRQQWAGWTGEGAAPSTFYMAGSTSLTPPTGKPSLSIPLRTGGNEQPAAIMQDGSGDEDLKHGVGGYVYTDKYGYFNRLSLGGSYAAHLSLNEKLNLGIGGNLGLTSIGINTAALTVVDDVNDDAYNALIVNNKSRMSVDFNIGMMLYSKQFFAGYSGYQFFGNQVFDKAASLEGKLLLQHNLMAGFNIEVNDQLNFIPTVLFKTIGVVPSTFDIGAKLLYEKKYWGGLALRNQDAMIVFLGAQLTDMFNVSYSYDLNTSEVKDYSSGGHELTVGASLTRKDQNLKNAYVW